MKLLDGTKIALLREQNGWSQRDLAVASHVDQSIISRLERGTQDDFNFASVLSVAEALRVPIDYLLLEPIELPAKTLVAELDVVIWRLNQRTERVQRHAARILAAYLTTLDETE